MKKYQLFILIQIIIAITLSSSVYSQAISEIDGFNDVYNQIISNNQTITIDNQQRPDLDVYKVLSYVKEDARIVDVSIAVKGSIKDEESIHYVVWYNTTNASYYLNYSNGKNNGWAIDLDTNEKYYQINPLQITDHIITATYDLIDDNPIFVELWGYSFESEINESETNFWFDYVPNTRTPSNINVTDMEDDGEVNGDNNQTTTDDTDTNNDKTSTPGFEIFLIFIATVSTIILLYRKNKI